jgi:hypothetical protein
MWAVILCRVLRVSHSRAAEKDFCPAKEAGSGAGESFEVAEFRHEFPQ